MLDETEFLSPYGVRALSRHHPDHPYVLELGGTHYTVEYQPAESNSGLFGGNSNWRGPIWFPVNYLIVESLQQFHHYYGDDFKVECPTGSGRYLTLNEIADELSRRLTSIFLRDADGRRPVFGDARAVPARSALARLHPVLRVLPRRHRRGRRRQPPDRLDRTGRQAARHDRSLAPLRARDGDRSVRLAEGAAQHLTGTFAGPEAGAPRRPPAVRPPRVGLGSTACPEQDPPVVSHSLL